MIKKGLKIYQYTPSGFGTSIATALDGNVRLEVNPAVPPTKFVEASGRTFNTIPPNDFSYFELVDELVQLEPATSFDTELLGQLAAIGIVKGKPFAPDARMKKILTDAAAVGNAAGRWLNWGAAEYPGWSYYPNSMWANMLWQGGNKTYKVTLPKNIPAGKFWSFTLYDNQTRSMLQTPQRYPRAGSQTYPSPAAVANADGSTTIYFGPSKPAEAKAGNWIQTTPGKGWFMLLRLYSPKETFFDKTWRPSEIELVSQSGSRALQ